MSIENNTIYNVQSSLFESEDSKEKFSEEGEDIGAIGNIEDFSENLSEDVDNSTCMKTLSIACKILLIVTVVGIGLLGACSLIGGISHPLMPQFMHTLHTFFPRYLPWLFVSVIPLSLGIYLFTSPKKLGNRQLKKF